MLAPIRLGDPLYPLEERVVDGIKRERRRQDWGGPANSFRQGEI